MSALDIRRNRATSVYNQREMLGRVLWSFGQWLIRLSPRPCFGWRRFVLRCFGARIRGQVNIYPSTRIYLPWNLSVEDWSAIGEGVLVYNLGPVHIGKKVTVSHGAHLCAGTHDYSRADFPLLRQPIRVEDEAWICAEAFIGPGVTIERGAVIGARAVVTKDVPAWKVVAGNPARSIGQRRMFQQLKP